MSIVYHNPKCRKSRAGLEYIRSKGNNVQVKEYIREGITAEEIGNLVQMLGIQPFDLVRIQEDFYKENLKGKEIRDAEWLHILSENPRLIRRPIVVNNGRAVIADPPEKADSVL